MSFEELKKEKIKESKELLELAKQAVEVAIEEGKKRGFEFEAKSSLATNSKVG